MDIESNPESPENLPTIENKHCPCCESTLSISVFCEACSQSVCPTCLNASSELCKLCSTLIFQISTSITNSLHHLQIENKNKAIEIIELERKFNRIRSNSKEFDSIGMQIGELSKEAEFVAQQRSQIESERKNLRVENEKLQLAVAEKEVKVQRLGQELGKGKLEMLECKKNSNATPLGYTETFLLNQELKQRINEIDAEHFIYTQQVVEALEMLKEQLEREKEENAGLRQGCVEKKEATEYERKREKRKELQEELREVRAQLQKMRGIEESQGFEPLNREEQPESNNCKCSIF